MNAPEDPDTGAWDDQAHALLGAISAYQVAHHAWIAAPAEQRAALRPNVRRTLETLWPMLEQVLAPVARSWSAAYRQRAPGAMNFAEAAAELTVSLCLEMVDTLPRLTFEPHRDPAPLLRTIARRRSVDAYRRWTRATDPGERAPPAAPLDPAEPRSPRIRELSLDDALLSALAEAAQPADGAFEAALIEHLDRKALFRQIAEYWNRELTAEDWLLVHARYIADPPLPYEELILRLGPGWSSARARKRLSRLLERTAAFLRRNPHDPDASA